MKKYTFLISVLISLMLVSQSMVAQIPDFTWTNSAGGTLDDFCYGMTVDNAGNTYLTGKFKSAPMNIGNGVQLSSVGNFDIYVIKYAPDGTPVWAVQAGSEGTASPDEARAVAVDAAGNVIVTGAFFGAAVFDTDTLYSTGNFDAFIAKYDISGNYQWVVQGKGVNQNKGTAAIVDNDGNYILAGYFAGTATDTININGTVLTSAGNRDSYIIKMDPNGSIIWSTTLGGPESGDETWGIDIDAANNIYISGYFKDTASFGPFQLISDDGYDAFTAKLNSSGVFQWVTGMHGPSSDRLYSLSYNDNEDEVYVTGYFEDTVTVGTQELYSNGRDDILIAALKGADGTVLGQAGFGSTLDDQGKGIAVKTDGSFYVTGYIDADLIIGNDTLFTNGEKDFFVLHMYQDSLLSMKNYGGVGDDEAQDAVLNNNDLFIAGYFKSLEFYVDDDTLFTQGSRDIFIGKLIQDIIPVEFTTFTFDIAGDAVSLRWTTATETNNLGFEIERSYDNVQFSKIAFVEGSGTSTSANSYTYTDKGTGSAKVYYRLKQIDFDGTTAYSNTIEVDLTVPQKFQLSQNYPNPFNPSTTINFDLPFDSHVQISLFNVLGQRVADILEADYSAGRFSFNIDGTKLTSGIYFYQIKADAVNGEKYMHTKKMMLMK